LLALASRWTGSLGRPLEHDEFAALAAEARRLLDIAPDGLLEAKLVCARAFETTSNLARIEIVVELREGVERAATLLASQGDVEAGSEALDALASVYRSCYDDPAEGHRGDASAPGPNVGKLSLLERVDAWSVLTWDLVYAGRYDERSAPTTRRGSRAAPASRILSCPCHRLGNARRDARRSLGRGARPGRFAAGDARGSLNARWGEFTFPGWAAAIRVAAARLDTTRLAQYRSAFAAIAQVDLLTEPNRWLWTAMIERMMKRGAALSRRADLQP
jgi:hypothetical protein